MFTEDIRLLREEGYRAIVQVIVNDSAPEDRLTMLPGPQQQLPDEIADLLCLVAKKCKALGKARTTVKVPIVSINKMGDPMLRR